jgi:hypothetical protein
MKCSVGVAVCAIAVLIGSVLALIGAAGAAIAFLGPLSGQLLDPAALPPGADVRVMRAGMLSGLFFVGAFAALGIAVGIGLIRLWKWARYAAIALGVLVILFSVLPGLFFAFVPLPASTANGPAPAAVRWIMVGFYLFWAAMAGIFLYVMTRQSTVAQFNGGLAEPAPRVRPLSVTIIAWLMIASGLMTLPVLAWAHMPAVFFGLVMTGIAARIFYGVYTVAYVVIGVGLIRRTTEAIPLAIALHAIMLLNALTMIVPGVWRRYQDAMAAISPMFANEGAQAGRYYGVFFGAAVAGAFLFFLLRARRTLAAAANHGQ